MIEFAYAATTSGNAPAAGGGMSSIVLIILMVVIFYFMLIRPESKRKKQAEEMRSSLPQGQEERRGREACRGSRGSSRRGDPRRDREDRGSGVIFLHKKTSPAYA